LLWTAPKRCDFIPASSFSKFLPHTPKITICHQIPFRQNISHNLLDIPKFQNFPIWIPIEKIAETCEFDGKELLFVERAIGMSKRVLGRASWETQSAAKLSSRSSESAIFLSWKRTIRRGLKCAMKEKFTDMVSSS